MLAAEGSPSLAAPTSTASGRRTRPPTDPRGGPSDLAKMIRRARSSLC